MTLSVVHWVLVATWGPYVAGGVSATSDVERRYGVHGVEAMCTEDGQQGPRTIGLRL